jgi:hypothetical protein
LAPHAGLRSDARVTSTRALSPRLNFRKPAGVLKSPLLLNPDVSENGNAVEAAARRCPAASSSRAAM